MIRRRPAKSNCQSDKVGTYHAVRLAAVQAVPPVCRGVSRHPAVRRRGYVPWYAAVLGSG